MKALGKQSGFTLIELMLVTTLIGVLSSIALPAYFEYTTRTKVAECVTAMANAKTVISEYYSSQGVLPPAGSDNIGFAGDLAHSDLCDTVSFNGINAIELVTEASFTDGDLSGANNMQLVVMQTTPSGIDWDCKVHPINPVPAKYLPQECRD